MATTIWYSNPTSGNAMDWTDTNQWNTATDGSGTAGNPDSTDDKAIIQAGDTVTLDANVTTGGCSNEGTLIGNASFSLTLAGNDTDNNYNNSGTVTNLNLIMTGIRASGDRTVVDVGSGIRDFTLNDTTNSGNNVHVLGNNLSIDGDLTITSGTLNTQSFGTDRSLTVAGATTIGDGSSSADTATLTCNASTISLGSGVTGTHSLVVQAGGTFTGGTGTHTLGSLNIKNSTAAKCTLSSGNTTINGEGSANKAINIEGSSGTTNFAHGSGTVIITHDGASDIKADGVTLALNNLTINHASANINLKSNLSVAGNLTITAGELDTDSSNFALTVTGTTEVSGTLTCNASTVSLGSGYTGDYALLGSGTVNFGTGTNTVGAVNTHSVSGITKTSGTITFDTQKTGSQSIGPTVTSHNTHFNFGTSTVNFDLSGGAGTTFAIEQHSGSSKTLTITATTVNFKSNSYIYQNNTDTNIFKVIGDLVIDASKTLETYYDNADDFGSKVEVTGHVTLNGTLNAYSASNPKPMDFGSLTINDGGTYNATSGTTTITDEGDGSGGTNGYAWYNVTGTYTHNNGTVKFTGNSDTDIREDAFYNLIINGDTSSVDFYIRQKDGSSSSSGHIKIFNNLDIQRGGFQRAKSANELSVFGIIDICSGGTGGYFGDTSDTGIYNLGAVNIHNNGTLNLSNGDNNINSIRNIAGTVAQD
jgi:hypothetical protein